VVPHDSDVFFVVDADCMRYCAEVRTCSMAKRGAAGYISVYIYPPICSACNHFSRRLPSFCPLSLIFPSFLPTRKALILMMNPIQFHMHILCGFGEQHTVIFSRRNERHET